MKKCCKNCKFLDKTQKVGSDHHSSYIYGCLQYGCNGVGIKNWIANDDGLNNLDCEDFKEKE